MINAYTNVKTHTKFGKDWSSCLENIQVYLGGDLLLLRCLYYCEDDMMAASTRVYKPNLMNDLIGDDYPMGLLKW